MSAPKSFDELTANAQWRDEVKAICSDVDDVDLQFGRLCESDAASGTPGFGFSDAAFRIFIVMARHYSALAPLFADRRYVFFPWKLGAA
jgi:hypothetical protein